MGCGSKLVRFDRSAEVARRGLSGKTTPCGARIGSARARIDSMEKKFIGSVPI
jgi:hypothetical protein